MRFGIWIAVLILEKFVLSLEVVVLVSAILSIAPKKQGGPEKADYALQVSTWNISSCLLNFDCCAGFGKFLLDVFCFVFGYAFLDRLRSAFDQILGLFQAKACDFTNSFNDTDLVTANRRKDDIEFRLLFSGSRCAGTPRRGRAGNSNRGCGCADAERFFQPFDELRSFEQR